MSIFELLPTGRDSAITTAELLVLTGFPNVRALQSAIRAERDAGALILSRKDGRGGYYRPGSSTEIRAFINLYESEARSIFAMLKAARREADRLEAVEAGQMNIGDIGDGLHAKRKNWIFDPRRPEGTH